MTIQQIPCDPVRLFWTQTTTLDGAAYLLSFFYNSREDAYYLNIDSADATISYATGVKLVPGVFLLSTYATPPGELVVLAPDAPAGDDSTPQLGELGPGARCQLLYIEEADLFAPGVGEDLHRFPGFIV